MKYGELTALSNDALMAKGVELRSELFHARMKLYGGRLSNPAAIKQLKRDIARVQTALTAAAKR